MGIFVYIFDKNKFNGDKLNSFLGILFDLQKIYFDELNKKYQLNDEYKSEYNEIMSKPLNDKIWLLKDLLLKIDATSIDIKYIEEKVDKTEEEIDNTKVLKDLSIIYKKFIRAYAIFVKLYKYIDKHNNDKDNYLQSSYPIIIEFHKFLSHFSYGYYMFINTKEYTSYIDKNYQRGVVHLEVATLDIYKIINMEIVKKEKILFKDNEDLFIPYLKQSLQTRANEINNLSINREAKLDTYYKNIKEILEDKLTIL
jgi:hypothetical protein